MLLRPGRRFGVDAEPTLKNRFVQSLEEKNEQQYHFDLTPAELSTWQNRAKQKTAKVQRFRLSRWHQRLQAPLLHPSARPCAYTQKIEKVKDFHIKARQSITHAPVKRVAITFRKRRDFGSEERQPST